MRDRELRLPAGLPPETPTTADEYRSAIAELTANIQRPDALRYLWKITQGVADELDTPTTPNEPDESAIMIASDLLSVVDTLSDASISLSMARATYTSLTSESGLDLAQLDDERLPILQANHEHLSALNLSTGISLRDAQALVNDLKEQLSSKLDRMKGGA